LSGKDDVDLVTADDVSISLEFHISTGRDPALLGLRLPSAEAIHLIL
jgi:hypothetical protein